MSEIEMCRGLSYRLKECVPVISDMPAQQVVSIEINGDPNQQTAKLMPLLYSAAYAVRKRYKEKGMPFKVEKLRGRWPQSNITKSKDSWTGAYALPIPNDAITLPAVDPDKQIDSFQVKVEEWQYGQVAYILHVGPYSTEERTIQLLLDYIASKGMRVVANSHEEIYLSDPRKTAEDKLKTIILYRVE